MRIIRGSSSPSTLMPACVATIGNFDGVHLGHQKIINALKEKATELNLPLTIISFEPLPSEYFMPDPPARIYSFRDKVRLLKSMGVDTFYCLKFDKKLANMSPEEFIKKILQEQLNVKHLIVGDDFRFGYQRKGDFKLLQSMGTNTNMMVADTPTYEFQDQRISSTRVRRHLENGGMSLANILLGTAYQLSGRIRHGDKRGRTIGFPTLNLRMLTHIAPQKGVYAVKVHCLESTAINGVANLGVRPTVNGSENRLEIHLFDFEREVYGKYITVELVSFIRPEKKFDNFELLKEQIQNDANEALKRLIA